MAIKRSNGEGTIRQRPDGRWEARYTVGFDPGTGKQVQRSVYGATQADVVKKLRDTCKAIDDGMYTEPAKMKLSAWLDVWLEEYTGNVKEHTRVTYETQVRVHISPRWALWFCLRCARMRFRRSIIDCANRAR